MYWRYSIYELTKKVELKVGHMTSQVLSVHASMIDVVSAVFGKGDKPKKVLPENDVTSGAPSMEHALASMNRLLTFG